MALPIEPQLTPADYTQPTVYHEERQQLCRGTWLLAAHVSQLPMNTQLATTIAGNPIRFGTPRTVSRPLRTSVAIEVHR